MSAYEFIEKLRSQGRYLFTVQEMEQALKLKKIAAINALHRLRKNKMVTSPARGFLSHNTTRIPSLRLLASGYVCP